MVEVNGEAASSDKKGRHGPMDEGELKGILNAKVTNSLGYYGGKLSKARVTALQYYNGEPFGNEQIGRSSVVSRDVAEAIDSMMPSLVKIFTAGAAVVRFDAQKPEDEDKAAQATDYVNWIWEQQNEGFRNIFNWFKDSLLNRTSAIKIWWDEEEEVTKEEYEGLTDQEYEMLLEDADEDALEIIKHDTYPDPHALVEALTTNLGAPLAGVTPPAVGGPQPSPAGPNPATAQSGVPSAPAGPGAGLSPAVAPPQPPAPPPTNPMLGHNMPPALLHDVVLRRTNKNGRIRILPIPGEEFLMDRRAVSLDETPFCAHRKKTTVSDLLEMGYPWDKVKNLGEGDSSDFNLERLERFRQEDELPYRTGNNYDPSMKEVWINECYLKVDFDGDGIAEMRKIVFAGESGNFAPGATVILSNEEIDDHPFAAVTPNPMPHKFYGMSIMDQVGDLQLIKSTLWRAVLDHTYNAIMPQVAVIDGQVNLDDLLTRRPGGVVRTKMANAVTEIPAGEMGVDPYQMISYVDQVREQRTGVQRFTVGPGANTLDNAYTETATGANLVESSSQERLELVARCFAEIGVKPAFRKILKLVSKYQQKPRIIRLRGKWVPMDPREWDTEFDVSVAVGLGTGNRQQQVQGIMALLSLDEKLIEAQGGMNGPLINWDTTYAKAAKLVEYVGLKNPDAFYTDPAGKQLPPSTKPDPKVQAAQIAAQADQAKTQAQIQADHAKAQSEAQLDMVKMRLQMQADHQKLMMELQLKREIEMAKVQADREIQWARIAADREEFNAETHLKFAQHQTDAALAARQQAHEEHTAAQDAGLRQAEMQHNAQNSERELGIKEKVANQPKEAAPAKEPTPAKEPPKLMKVKRVRNAEGRLSGVERHYGDGSIEHIPIE